MPRGGARPGAGRPKGRKDKPLTPTVMKALRTINPKRYRVPDDAPPEMAELADRALQRISDVMEEGVEANLSPSVLKAAATIREEVCGPVEKKIRLTGTLEMMLAQLDTEDDGNALPTPITDRRALP